MAHRNAPVKVRRAKLLAKSDPEGFDASDPNDAKRTIPAGLLWDPENPLIPIKRLKESDKANKALADYATMGVARTLRKVLARYQATMREWTDFDKNPALWRSVHLGPDGKTPLPDPIQPPTTQWQTIADWSSMFFWQDRVRRWDEIQVKIEELEFEASRRQAKQFRLNQLNAALSRLNAALANLKSTDASWSETMNGIARLQEQQRMEYGETEGDDGSIVGRVKLVMVRMPAKGKSKSDDEE